MSWKIFWKRPGIWCVLMCGNPVVGYLWKILVVQEWITISFDTTNEFAFCKDNSRGNIHWWSNLTKLSDLFWISKRLYFDLHIEEVFSQWQATVESNTKVSCRWWGWNYFTTKDYWGRLNLISLLRVANYEEFSFRCVDRKTIGSEPGINFVKGGGEQGETVISRVATCHALCVIVPHFANFPAFRKYFMRDAICPAILLSIKFNIIVI